MRKEAVAVTLISALLITAAAGTQVALVHANFIPIEVWVESPKETACATHDVPLTFKALVYAYYYSWYRINYTITSVSYSIDGKANITVPTSISKDGEDNQIITAQKTLAGLSEGPHEVVVYATAQMGKVYSLRKSFAVDTTQPEVSIVLIESGVFFTSEVALNLTTSEPCSQIKYSLDGEENVTIAGNALLTGLPVGVHNVTVYAWDLAGNVGFSETVTFTVAEPETSPIVPLATVSAAVVVVVAAGLLLLFRKRRREAGQA